MAVISSRMIRSRALSVGKDGKIKGQRVYLVRCADKINDGPETALAACPQVNAIYNSANPTVLASNADAKERSDVPADGGTLYEVAVDYESGEAGQEEPNPLDRPPVARLTFVTSQEEIYKAKDDAPTAISSADADVSVSPWKWGKRICNSSGIAFDQTLSETFRDPMITITKNLDVLPWEFSINWLDTINKEEFTFRHRGRVYTIPKHCAWISDITNEPMKEGLIEYEECKLVMQIRKETWLRKILDAGFVTHTGTDGGASGNRPIRDKDGNPVLSAAALDGKGGKATGTSSVFLKFRTKEEKDFSTIPFFR
jgi:hypothetical protein